eukprot:TRINITY_DN47600_c0_g1_i1.p2 TRINITY_DN47600_c0_g1~~TRINITY_DN47600_c0_g1_i1.p2  ORF type:complete len:173 (+),score=68.50 TRINITY_DN47600_c0_g1_i1:55-519(+)
MAAGAMCLSGTPEQLKGAAALSGVLALAFWVWALINIINGKGFDLGVVSFASAGAASAAVYRTATMPPGWLTWAVVAAFLFVAVNYAIGAVAADKVDTKMGHVGFRIYCIAGALWWLLSAVVVGRAVRTAVERRRDGSAINAHRLDDEDESLAR